MRAAVAELGGSPAAEIHAGSASSPSASPPFAEEEVAWLENALSLAEAEGTAPGDHQASDAPLLPEEATDEDMPPISSPSPSEDPSFPDSDGGDCAAPVVVGDPMLSLEMLSSEAVVLAAFFERLVRVPSAAGASPVQVEKLREIFMRSLREKEALQEL